ncbi:NADP-dependent oxidoreductase domain-containing protein [Colletotrichum navitas]|uniref:NADP-dependent oxidoreductase domain-containing protein n=1 Tax=Colletotrichum navitas TaxID=681940 RepID=A0AAD8PZB2_9PEZI|nr:NADP-dependent oxidoreductase domain-containing protein [Colletotrichum navitas]KAK1590334.1 NADP-dependent oxidoreductase domain-containing protein [Colletotrichum navitas]
MPLATHFTLNTGAEIPAVGFGTWQAGPHEVERAVETALRSGYRHIDCAAIYRNEAEVSEGIRKSGVPRSDIFVTGKLWNTKHAPEDVESGVDKTLRGLGTDYLDLFLMHWPVRGRWTARWSVSSPVGSASMAASSSPPGACSAAPWCCPRASPPAAFESNLQVRELPADVFQQLNGLEKNKRFDWQTRWGFDVFQELGEEEAKRVAQETGPENLKKFTI